MNPTPKKMPDAANRTASFGVKNPIGPITVERIKTIRIQRGKVLDLQQPIANKSTPTANNSAPIG
jgi:hypothetical protein